MGFLITFAKYLKNSEAN